MFLQNMFILWNGAYLCLYIWMHTTFSFNTICNPLFLSQPKLLLASIGGLPEWVLQSLVLHLCQMMVTYWLHLGDDYYCVCWWTKSEVDGLHIYYYRSCLLSVSNIKPHLDKIEFDFSLEKEAADAFLLNLCLLNSEDKTFSDNFTPTNKQSNCLSKWQSTLYSVNSLTQECK